VLIYFPKIQFRTPPALGAGKAAYEIPVIKPAHHTAKYVVNLE